MGTAISVSSLQQDEVNKHKKQIRNKPKLIAKAFGFKLMKQKRGNNVEPPAVPSRLGYISQHFKAPTRPDEIETPQQTNKLLKSDQVEDVQKNRPSRPSRPVLISPVRVSSAELLLCLGRFLRRRCFQISDLTSNEVISWFRNVDRTLLMQGWQDDSFITAPVLVFVYLLCRDAVSEDITSPAELQGEFLTCLYLTYSYLGTEISYPLQPFIIAANKDEFWTRTLSVIEKLSSEMLRINTEPQFFSELLQELKNEGLTKNQDGPDR